MERKTEAMLFIPVVLTLIFTAAYPAFAQGSAARPVKDLKGHSPALTRDDSQPPVDSDLELFKRDVRSQKKQIIAANMNLQDAEAEKFWPVYDRYSADLAKIYDTKIALIEAYVENYQTMTGDEAENYLNRRAVVEEDIMRLRHRYVPEFRKVLSGRQTALFFQIDWRLDLLINLQLAHAPMIDP